MTSININYIAIPFYQSLQPPLFDGIRIYLLCGPLGALPGRHARYAVGPGLWPGLG